MIVRIEVAQHDITSVPYWQLKQCQVQRGGIMEHVCDPTYLRPIRFKTLEDAVRHAKKTTFTYLEANRQKEMPDQIDWRIVDEGRMLPCPLCHQPLYQKAKLGRFGNMLDLHDWGCPRCKKTVTLTQMGCRQWWYSLHRTIPMHCPPCHTVRKRHQPGLRML